MNKNHKALALLLALALGGAAQAQVPSHGNVKDYHEAGYVGMDSLTTPLQHYAHTGEKFDGEELLKGAHSALPKDIQRTFSRIRGNRNEFEIRELTATLDAFVEQQATRVREARGVLYQLEPKLLAYDFRRGGFPLELKLPVKAPKSERSYYCEGAFGTVTKPIWARLKSCVSASNLASEPAFRFLPVPDQARAGYLREMHSAHQLVFLAVALPEGAYRPIRDRSLMIGDGLSASAMVMGVQPTLVVGVLVIDKRNGEILEILRAKAAAQAARKAEPAPAQAAGPEPAPAQGPSPGPAAPASPATPEGASSSQIGSGPTIGDPPPPPGPGEDTPAPVAPERRDISMGPPGDQRILDLDKLLSALSYAVYGSPGKISTARRELQELKDESDRIGKDEARLEPIQKKELQKLASKIEAKERDLEGLLHREQVKREIPQRFGARPVPSTAQLPRIHYERWRLADGREVIAFRGTDNLQDVETDLQLALNPQTVGEIAGNAKHLLQKTIVTGVSGVQRLMPRNYDPNSAGRPEAFRSAEALVASVVRSGVPAARIILTGHSLGGGLAAFAGEKNRVGTVVTFNTAPLSPQLLAELAQDGDNAPAELRHYVAYVSRASGGITTDPVSQARADYLGLPEVQTLQVKGRQYVVEVCSDVDGPEFTSWMNTAQGFVTKATVGVMAKGTGAAAVGLAGGALAGAVHSSSDTRSSALAGAKVGRSGATAVGAGVNCLRHPFKCAAVAAGGGVASAAVRHALPSIWSAFVAHKMKYLYRAMETDGKASCEPGTEQLAE